MSAHYLQKELSIALLAVARACNVTHRIFVSLRNAPSSASSSTITKEDKSPVTIADFASQALVNAVLKDTFPGDPIVGEEDSGDLRKSGAMTRKVWDLVKDTLTEIKQGDVGNIHNEEEMLEIIDRGNYAGGRTGRMWTLDPIDGTKGFLRGGQYAVCLALIIDGSVELGIIGCPNLPHPSTNSTGIIISAVRGLGAFQRPLFSPASQEKVHMKVTPDISQAIFCESVEAGHSSHDENGQVAKLLGITTQSVRMDSQAKYASLARGDAEIYLRLPVSASYEEKIWDHAGGKLIVEEAGGKVTDMYGNDLDFGNGRTLKSKGVIATEKALHAKIIEAVKKVVNAD